MAEQRRSVDDSERALGRAVAVGLPLAAAAAAVVVTIVASFGSALLVLAAGALLGTIAFLWASVRTLSGDAPVGEELTVAAARRHGVDALAERKREALRALRDLESEHAVGRIDDDDYQEIVARYREQAKIVLREMDARVGSLRDRAERIAREYLDKRTRAQPTRRTCAACGASNEVDAAFCKKCGASMRAEGDDA